MRKSVSICDQCGKEEACQDERNIPVGWQLLKIANAIDTSSVGSVIYDKGEVMLCREHRFTAVKVGPFNGLKDDDVLKSK